MLTKLVTSFFCILQMPMSTDKSRIRAVLELAMIAVRKKILNFITKILENVLI